MPLSLPALVVKTAKEVQARWREILATVLLLAAVQSALQGLQAWRLAQYRASVLDDTAVQRDVQQLEGLLLEQRRGDHSADAEIAEIRARISSRLSLLTGRRTPQAFWAGIGPLVLLLWVATLLTVLVGFITGLRFSAGITWNWKAMARDISHDVWPLTLLVLTIFGLSLLWIPAGAIILTKMQQGPLSEQAATVQMVLVFIGYLVAVLVLPRLAAAPLLQLEERLSVRDALWRSVYATRGYWGKILGNILAVLIALFVFSATVLTTITSIIGRNPPALLIPRAFLLQASVLLFGLFIAFLSKTILEYPLPVELESEPLPMPEPSPAQSAPGMTGPPVAPA